MGDFETLPACAIEAFGFDSGCAGLAGVGSFGNGGVERGVALDFREALGLLRGHGV